MQRRSMGLLAGGITLWVAAEAFILTTTWQPGGSAGDWYKGDGPFTSGILIACASLLPLWRPDQPASRPLHPPWLPRGVASRLWCCPTWRRWPLSP